MGGVSNSTPEKNITSAESWYVTLTYLSEGSKLPKGDFQVEVPTMIGTTTLISVKFARFFYSKNVGN